MGRRWPAEPDDLLRAEAVCNSLENVGSLSSIVGSTISSLHVHGRDYNVLPDILDLYHIHIDFARRDELVDAGC